MVGYGWVGEQGQNPRVETAYVILLFGLIFTSLSNTAFTNKY